MAKKLDIEVRYNTEVNPKVMRSLLHQFDAAVVAAGAGVDLAALPAPEAPDTLVTANDVALGRITPGRNVVVIGGGKIGLTLAESLKNAGHDVTVVESEKRIAGDVMPSWKWRHTAWVEELDIPVFTLSRVVRIGHGGVTFSNGKGEERQVPADTVIAAMPSRGNQELVAELEWSIDELHVCGDSVVPRGLTQAIHDGYRLGCRL
jgi:2,4-dienoyl-CoA reductase (NADPH2)